MVVPEDPELVESVDHQVLEQAVHLVDSVVLEDLVGLEDPEVQEDQAVQPEEQELVVSDLEEEPLEVLEEQVRYLFLLL